MDNIIDFYEKTLRSFGLEVKDGFIKTTEKPITINGKPFVVPTKDQIANLYEPNERGEFIANKIIFNPLYERLTNNDSASIKYLKKYIEHKLILTYSMTGSLLLKVYQSNSKNLGNRVSDFVILMNSAKSKQIKKLVDDKVEKKWKTITEKAFKDADYKPISVSLKKGVVKEGEKFYRGFVIDSPILETLEEDDYFSDSSKARNVIKIIITFLNTLINRENDNIVAISSDNVSPTFMVLLKAWFKIGTEINKLLEELKFVDTKVCEMLKFNLEYDLKDLNFEKFKNQAETLPYESDDGIIYEDSHEEQLNPSNDSNSTESELTDNLDFILKNANPNVDVKQELYEASVKKQQSTIMDQTRRQPDRIPLSSQPIQQQVYGQPALACAPQMSVYQQPVMQTPLMQQSYGQPTMLAQQESPFVRDPRSGLLFDKRVSLLFDDKANVYIDPNTMSPIDIRVVRDMFERQQQSMLQPTYCQSATYAQPTQTYPTNTTGIKTRPGRRF